MLHLDESVLEKFCESPEIKISDMGSFVNIDSFAEFLISQSHNNDDLIIQSLFEALDVLYIYK